MSTAHPAPPTFWELVVRLKAEGAPRAVMLQTLKDEGLDDESAHVLINSVIGVLPTTIPHAQFSPGTNVQLPSQLSLSDIGLIGPPAVVAMYWLGLGVAILLALGLVTAFTWSGLASLPEGVGFYGVRLGAFTSVLSIAWGVYRFVSR